MTGPLRRVSKRGSRKITRAGFRTGDYVHVKGLRMNGNHFTKGYINSVSGSHAEIRTPTRVVRVHVATLVHLRDPIREKVEAARQLELLR